MFRDPPASANSPEMPDSRRLLEAALTDPDQRRCLFLASLVHLRPPNQEAQATEIVNEVALRALQVHHRFDPSRGTVLPWLIGVAHNILRERQRKQKYVLPEAPQGPISWEKLVDSLAAPSRDTVVDGVIDVQHYLDSLPVSDQALLRARFYRDLDYHDLAALLNITETAARLRVYRVLKRLRERFGGTQGRNADECQ